MRRDICRRLMISILMLLVGTSSMIFSMQRSVADVKIRVRADGDLDIYIFNKITKKDANYIIQREAEFGYKGMFVSLNSSGGDVDAAMQIGRMVRKYESGTLVHSVDERGTIINPVDKAKCYSACALIYIAGVRRDNFGIIGLHRPYFASVPQSRQSIETQVPLMLQKLKSYVQEMSVSDNFYQEMVNIEPSAMKLYETENITKLVSKRDPTYDEVLTSYKARKFGVDTAEARQREADTKKCKLQDGAMAAFSSCLFSTLWGLSEGVYVERYVKTTQCNLSNEENSALKLVKDKEKREHSLTLKYETCVRNIMLGR